MSTKPFCEAGRNLTKLSPGITLLTVKVLIAAGEKSGFILAELLEAELKRLDPQTQVTIFDISRSLGSTMGFWEGVTKISRLPNVFTTASRLIKQAGPHVFVPISFPGVNIILSRIVRKQGIRVIYLAPPQLWAWGKFRVKMLPRCADRFICLFAFEEEILRRLKLNAHYFGYPLLDAVVARRSEPETMALLGFSEKTNYIAFLPGSRTGEIRFHQPLFIKLFGQLQRRDPTLRGVIIGGEELPLPEGMVRVTPENRYEIIRYARAAVVVSGTATAETAIFGTPMVVCYHFDQPSRFFARMFVHLEYFSIPNLVLKERAVPELFEPDWASLNKVVRRLLEDEEYRAKMMLNLARVKKLLGPPGAMAQIARIVLHG